MHSDPNQSGSRSASLFSSCGGLAGFGCAQQNGWRWGVLGAVGLVRPAATACSQEMQHTNGIKWQPKMSFRSFRCSCTELSAGPDRDSGVCREGGEESAGGVSTSFRQSRDPYRRPLLSGDFS